MAKLRVGVIGFNGNAQTHTKLLMNNRRVEVVAACDLVEELRNTASNEFGIQEVYGDYREMLAQCDLDAAVVSTPAFVHAPASIAALKAGCHVLCEKPPAVNAAEAKAMAREAEKGGRVLTFGLQRRFEAVNRMARRQVEKGSLGDVYRVNAEFRRQMSGNIYWRSTYMVKPGGGVFLDLGVHVLDLAWWLMGRPKPRRVVAHYQSNFSHYSPLKEGEEAAEDAASALIFFSDDRVISLETAFMGFFRRETKPPQWEILGNKAGLEVPSLTLVSPNGKKSRTPKPWVTKERTLKPLNSMTKIQGRQALHENFIDAILGRAELEITPEQGVDLMKMLDAVARSAEKKREVRIT